MALRNPPTWLQQGSHMAVDDRLMLQSVVPHGGVADIGSMYVRQTPAPSMTVEIDSGGAFVQGTQLFNQGMYHCFNEAPIEISIAPASAQYPRIDLVVLRVYDAEVSASINECRFEVITGSAAVVPITPPLPVNSIPLATVEVPAEATQILGVNIADERIFARTRSAPEWITSEQSPVEAIAGEQFFETDTGRPRYWNGTALRYPGHRAVATSTLRPSDAYTGLEIFETDTGRILTYQSGKWMLTGGKVPYVTLRRTTVSSAFAANAWLPISWNAVADGDTSMWNAGTPERVTVPIDGIYLCVSQWKLDDTNTGGDLFSGFSVQNLSSRRYRGQSMLRATGAASDINSSALIPMSAGEWVQAELYTRIANVFIMSTVEISPRFQVTWMRPR